MLVYVFMFGPGQPLILSFPTSSCRHTFSALRSSLCPSLNPIFGTAFSSPPFALYSKEPSFPIFDTAFPFPSLCPSFKGTFIPHFRYCLPSSGGRPCPSFNSENSILPSLFRWTSLALRQRWQPRERDLKTRVRKSTSRPVVC